MLKLCSSLVSPSVSLSAFLRSAGGWCGAVGASETFRNYRCPPPPPRARIISPGWPPILRVFDFLFHLACWATRGARIPTSSVGAGEPLEKNFFSSIKPAHVTSFSSPLHPPYAQTAPLLHSVFVATIHTHSSIDPMINEAKRRARKAQEGESTT